MARTLVRAHTLLTQSRRHGDLRGGALVIEDGVIRRVGPLEELEALGGYDNVIGDSERHIALPGMVNAHHHCPRPSKVGLAAGPLEIWLTRSRFRNLPPATESEIYDLTQWAAAQFLKSGVTGVVDHYQSFGRPEERYGVAGSIQAYLDSGIRAAVCISSSDQQRLAYEPDEDFLRRLPRDLAGTVRATLRPFDADAYFALCEELAKQYDGQDGRLRVGYAPTAAQWCSDELLVRTRRAADERNHAPVQIHLLETRFQAMYGYRRYGRSLPQHLADIGFFGEATSCAHCVWTSPSDVPLLADVGAVVVHNPSSNLILSSGIAPIAEYLDGGVQVGFGQDSADFNESLDMLTDLRLGLRLQRKPEWDKREVTPSDMLGMVTHGGAPALGLGSSLGRLEEGFQADVVLVDRTRLYSSPMIAPSEPADDILLRRATADDVEHVLVGGKVRVQDRQVVGVDLRALEQRIARSLERVYEQLDSIDDLFDRVEPYVSEFYRQWESELPDVLTPSRRFASQWVSQRQPVA